MAIVDNRDKTPIDDAFLDDDNPELTEDEKTRLLQLTADEDDQPSSPPEKEAAQPEEDVQPASPPAAAPPTETEEQVQTRRSQASANEAILQKKKNDQLVAAVDEANQIIEVTNDEIKAAYPGVDLEDLPEWQISLMKDNLLNKKRLGKVNEVVEYSRTLNQWSASVDSFIDDPATAQSFPELEGKQGLFKKYAMQDDNKNLPLDKLAKLFVIENPKPAPKRGSMFQTSAAGDRKSNSPSELSSDDLRLLRTQNPRKYREILMSGKAGKLDL